ncbi:deoxyribodipyrimidine photo-lyase [Vibrio zhanjiangensis]|uniref:Deoxyribodipyrimidine photo-lyase n=1 Tax=Vibrio zhanjiangensis TaxID=1046128 RepID=A0ABQ6EZD7_9VIBR|nr:deoxyribodipyrimidine photo-lyase [Vibrio zhanjiangensis]GLT18016.1 deoxyribodipyrimidine photo-lyase [Vibrio zhanjiangensis]
MKLVWLRRDLRVDDNTALNEALVCGGPVVCIYIATPETWQSHGLAPIQADLIFRRLCELSKELSALNIELLYDEVPRFSDSASRVAEVARELNACMVLVNREYEVHECQRDDRLASQLSIDGIDFQCCEDKCIFAPGTIINKQGSYFKVFTPFKNAYLAKLGMHSFDVKKAQTAVEAELPSAMRSLAFHQDVLFNYPRKDSTQWQADTGSIITELREFDANLIDRYAKERDFPSIQGTSKLSPYLAIGALSVRQCMARLMYGQTLPLSQGREVWQSELIWREFYQHLIYFETKLSKGRCFLDWGDELRWHTNTQWREAWENGQTGYPIVDAAMRQLNHTGWMHNRLRMIVASFLIKDLHIDWRVGERYFINNLIDGDYAANNGGWQWCASTGCDGQPYFRIFNPITQGERFDPSGAFVRQWIPELANVPDKYIHKPWAWPDVRNLSYPQPIVDHKVEREVTLRLYKEAKDA